MIYLDHHAASPPRPEALEAMARARAEGWANPASTHAAGQRARALLEDARSAVAAAVSAKGADVVFTSGGTEAVNLGILGLGRSVRRVMVTAIEHPAVMEGAARLAATGAELIVLPCVRGRAPTAEAVAAAAGPDTLLAMQWVNHETGTVLPVTDLARAAKAGGARVVIDATQALGKVPVSVAELEADAVALASTKMGGPSGAGALWVRRGVDVPPVLAGGAQERGRRPGSPDVVTQTGFGAAAAVVGTRLAAMPSVAARRDRLEAALVGLGAVVNGAEGPRVATVTNVSFRGWRGAALVAALDLEGLCAASGAACSSGLAAPSPVLLALYPEEPWRAEGALRLSLGPGTTDDEVTEAIAILRRVVPRAKLDAR